MSHTRRRCLKALRLVESFLFFEETDDDGHLLGDCTYLPFVQLRVNPELAGLIQNKDRWPGCICMVGSPLWLGKVLGLHGVPQLKR